MIKTALEALATLIGTLAATGNLSDNCLEAQDILLASIDPVDNGPTFESLGYTEDKSFRDLCDSNYTIRKYVSNEPEPLTSIITFHKAGVKCGGFHIRKTDCFGHNCWLLRDEAIACANEIKQNKIIGER